MANATRISKGEVMKSMMNHPNTSKLMKEALSSPLGSTSRMKSQKLFSIMKKLHGSNDGMGGPGIDQEQSWYSQMPKPEMDPVHIPTENSKGMVIFHKIPTPKITHGKKAPAMDVARKDQPRAGSFDMKADGQGGPGIQYERMGAKDTSVYDGAGGWISDAFNATTNAVSNWAGLPETPKNTVQTKPTTASPTNWYDTAMGAFNTAVANAAKDFAPAKVVTPKPTPAAVVAPTSNFSVNNGIQAISKLPGGLGTAYKPLATISQGVANTFNPDFKRAEPAPGHTPGLIEKAGNFITDKAIPTTLRTAGGALSSLAGLVQSGASTGLKLGSDIFHGLAGRDIGDYDPTITKYSDTWGAKTAKEIMAPLAPKTSVSAYASLNGIKYDNAGNQIKDGLTPITSISDPSKPFSSLNGVNYDFAGRVMPGGTDQTATDSGASTYTGPATGPSRSGEKTGKQTEASVIKSGYEALTGNTGQTGKNNTTTTIKYVPGDKTFSNAIATVESKGQGDYKAVGKIMGAGSSSEGFAALGKYQIMPNFWFDKLNPPLDPYSEADRQKFLNTPALQDQLHQIIVDGLATEYGNDPAKMAAAYFGGKPGVAALGTPEGDKLGDGINTLNQYVTKVMNSMGNTDYIATASGSNAGAGVESGSGSGSGSGLGLTNADGSPRYSGIAERVNQGVKNSLGAEWTANSQIMDPTDPVTHGLSAAQERAENQKSIWNRYEIKSLMDNSKKLKLENETLKPDMIKYIRDNDMYLKQTDKAIDDYMNTTMKQMDMSNPVNYQKAMSHLQTLYNLRGLQATAYNTYMNQGLNEHKKKLDAADADLKQGLAMYELDLKTADDITTDKYTNYVAALTGMYNAIQDRPNRILQTQLIQDQILTASGKSVSDSAKAAADQSFLKQAPDLDIIGIWDKSSKAAKTGTDLVRIIQEQSEVSPQLLPVNIALGYRYAVRNHLQTSPEKDGVTGTGVTNQSKAIIAKEALANFVKLARIAQPGGAMQNSDMEYIATTYIDELRTNLATIEAGKMIGNGKAPLIMAAVQKIAPGKTWYGTTPAPQTEDEFVKTLTGATKDPNDEALARNIFKVYEWFLVDSTTGKRTKTPQDAVLSMLTKTSSTQDKAANNGEGTPKTPEEFALLIGEIYANNVLNAAYKEN